MFAMTLVHFAILSFRGGALYNYYHHYADKAAMFDWVQMLGLTGPVLEPGAAKARRHTRMAWIYCACRQVQPGKFQRRRCLQQHHKHDWHGRYYYRPAYVTGTGREIRQEGRCGMRFRIGRIGHLRVLSAWPDQCQRYDFADDSYSDILCPNHPAYLGDICGRGGLFRMEDRTPIHRYCLRYHLLCVKNRIGARLVLVPVDYGRIIQLRYKAA